MSEDPNLHSLKKRLEKAKSNTDSAKPAEKPKSSGLAWRIGIELFVAVAVGFFIGQQIDIWTDTKPIFTAILTILGFAAGIKNVMVLAKKMQEAMESEDQSE